VFLVSKNYIDLMGKCLAGCVDCINTGVFRSSPFCCLATLLMHHLNALFIVVAANHPKLLTKLSIMTHVNKVLCLVH
jgi:hypothetical protein